MTQDNTPQQDDKQDDVPLSNRLKPFEIAWTGISEAIRDPKTRAFERVLMVTCATLGTGFLGLAIFDVPWFVYTIYSITVLGIAIIAYYGREPTENKGSPQS